MSPSLTTRTLAVAAFLLAALGGVAQAGPGLADDGAEPPGVETFIVPTRFHVQGTVEYPQVPPVGGNHNPVWQNCGFYSKPVINENAVHSMEHGAVWITYSRDLPSNKVQLLRSLAAEPYVLVSPYPSLPSPVVASAWGKQLRLNDPSDPRLADFVKYFAYGPQKPESGAPCVGGLGDPE